MTQPPRVGIVVVSHSAPLAHAAVALASEMVADDPPAMVVAAGTADGGTGTDATAVAAAIEEADAGAGVVALLDLGSAILSAELALEFLSRNIDVRLVPAPFVEGLVAAAVRAAAGASIDEVAREAAGALDPKVSQLGDAVPSAAEAPPEAAPEAEPDARGAAVLINTAGLHARPAGAIAGTMGGFDARVTIVATGRSADAASPTALAALAAGPGVEVTVTGHGPQAREAVDAVLALVNDGFGEERAPADPAADSASRAEPSPLEPSDPPAAPIGVSAGRVVGPVVQVASRAHEPPEKEVAPSAREAEAARIGPACEEVATRLREAAARVEGERAAILEATAAIARDPALRDGAVRLCEEGRTAERAVWEAAGVIGASLRAAGGRIAERATDVLDVRDRVIAALEGGETTSRDAREPHVLIARELAPADTVDLDPALCLAIVTERGAPTSHTAIIARELGIPAVVGARGATDIEPGTTVLVDGSTGEVVVDPDRDQRATVRERLAPQPLESPGATADGTEVALFANVAGPSEAREAAAWGAEGVGLMRTELAFLDRESEPSSAEQSREYAQVLAAFPGRRVVIRTLDAGSDKPVAYLPLGDEPNPALGVRGFRTARRHRALLERQLEAIAAAAADQQEAEAWVMAPMITTPDEAADFVALAREAGIARAGVMIETPAAALMAHQVAPHVDFMSIGTNDLAQYVMAADRESTALADLTDPWQPAVLAMIARVGRAGERAAIPVGVCGEAAARPDLAPVLVGLGVTSLSMAPRSLAAVAAAVAAASLTACREAASDAIAATSPAQARSLAARSLER